LQTIIPNTLRGLKTIMPAKKIIIRIVRYNIPIFVLAK